MRVQRRTNLLWGAVLLVVVGLWIANSFGALPPGFIDLINRVSPAVLILAGISFILRDRVPFSGVIALVIAIGAAGVIAFSAYNGRAARLSNATQQAIEQPVSENITLLRVNISTLATDVEVATAISRAEGLQGSFSGAAANLIEISYAENTDDTADMIIRERQTEGFPGLLDVGRGTFRLELPPDIPVDVQVNGTDGGITLNMSGLSLERLNVDTGRGNVVVSLPEYDPLFSRPEDVLGDLATRSGDLSLFIPREVRARLELTDASNQPDYDPSLYNLLVGGVLESRDIVGAEMVVRYTLTVPNGRVRVQVPS